MGSGPGVAVQLAKDVAGLPSAFCHGSHLIQREGRVEQGMGVGRQEMGCLHRAGGACRHGSAGRQARAARTAGTAGSSQGSTHS